MHSSILKLSPHFQFANRYFKSRLKLGVVTIQRIELDFY
jgi:hypothetical protein